MNFLEEKEAKKNALISEYNKELAKADELLKKGLISFDLHIQMILCSKAIVQYQLERI